MTREEQEERKTQNHLKRLNETITLCVLFLMTNASDIELSNKTEISSSTVGRRLTNRLNILQSYDVVKTKLLENGWTLEQIPENGEKLFELIATKRQENLAIGKSLGGQTTFLNHIYTRGSDGKFEGTTRIKLDALYKDPEKQYKFIVHAALTFRLHLDTLSQLLQIDENEMLENMIRIVPGAYEAITFLLYHDVCDQNTARQEFLEYYRELINAIRTKDSESKKKLISVVSDARVAKIKNEREAGDLISDEEILAILNYQIKYALKQDEVADMFKINRSNYAKRALKLLESDTGLYKKYEYLSDYNLSSIKGVRRHG